MKFKHEDGLLRFGRLCEPAKHLAHEMNWYFVKEGYDFIITESVTTEEEDKKVGRKSDSHRTFRAFDVRLKHIPKEKLKEFVKNLKEYFNKNFGSWGARVPRSDGSVDVVLIYDHGRGDNYHIHCQVRRDYSKIEIPKENVQ